ncbi:cyclin-K [Nilaparvata lugens]|uniref:cyclin-K n=1 Tax=Nilaparvata lugens TaxID=108931 RepID=UPI000B99CA9B|nr:cyclin-K [Nilaparvata lugens]
MPCWYYEKKELRNTPSAQDGIDYDTECRYRKEGARFIIDTGTKMDLGYNTMATGVVYFHRFYMYHSFRTFPRYVTACCCLFLAGKVEETPKKCRDIIKTASDLLTDQKFATFGDDPKEEVMTLERILLQTIKFDLQVDHPYGFLLKYAKCLKGDKTKLHKMVQMAWTFVNDSLCTTLCLQWEPEIIAVALMYLAGKLSKFEVVDWVGRTSKHLRWWDMFIEDVTMDLLEDICHQVLDLYSQPQTNSAPDSPPMTRAPPKKDLPLPPGPLPTTPVGMPLAPGALLSQTTVKASSKVVDAKAMMTNGSDKAAVLQGLDDKSTPPAVPGAIPTTYQYSSAPVAPPYSVPPTYQPHGYPAPPYAAAPPPAYNHTQYYPPPPPAPPTGGAVRAPYYPPHN